MKFDYDVIVVGAGHAGCEAAVAAAKLGASTLLITADLERVAQMSCNPAVGGIAKGQIVREIDALGGMMGIITDRTAIQFRMLNRSKGAAVWSPRAQSDRKKFSEEWRKVLEQTPGLHLVQDMVQSLIISPLHDLSSSNPPSPDTTRLESDTTRSDSERKWRVEGVRTALGIEFHASQVVLTAGTFLGGLMHFGRTQIEGGRISEASSHGITEQLVSIGFEVGRMKTGTPARISGKSVDFTLCERQEGDTDTHKFSFLPEVERTLNERPCYIAYTSPEVHEVLRDNLADSPLYNGQIQSIGPRYCPSIETKIVTFADKDSHHLFLEPEGETTDEYYINGFSSSLPWNVQLEALKKIPALRDVHFLRPGYAIEYDYFPPAQLRHDLQTRLVEGLYFAGQVNGTTGYEEAAAQGLMAGINAALQSKGEGSLTLARDEAYIGVLIDDLVTKGVDEPYRMFTSRAEYRILLRQDDADMRLTPIGYKIGLATEHRYQTMCRKRELRDALMQFLTTKKVSPKEEINASLEAFGTAPLEAGVKIADLLKRPQLNMEKLIAIIPELEQYILKIDEDLRAEVVEVAEILVKYEGYISRERELADKQLRLEKVRIPDGFDYEARQSLSTEARQKLSKHRPATIGEASRIPGVSPADISILLMLLGR